MKTIKVTDMHCGHCVARIEKALAAEKIEAQVRLEDKIVTVADDKVAAVCEILDDLGFTAAL